MGKSLTAGLICLLCLALAAAAAAADKPQLSDAGIYDVAYDIDAAGSLTVKKIRLTAATTEIVARPGVCFGVCSAEVLIKGQPLQAGYLHPEASASGRFWGVETGFSREG